MKHQHGRRNKPQHGLHLQNGRSDSRQAEDISWGERVVGRIPLLLPSPGAPIYTIEWAGTIDVTLLLSKDGTGTGIMSNRKFIEFTSTNIANHYVENRMQTSKSKIILAIGFWPEWPSAPIPDKPHARDEQVAMFFDADISRCSLRILPSPGTCSWDDSRKFSEIWDGTRKGLWEGT